MRSAFALAGRMARVRLLTQGVLALASGKAERPWAMCFCPFGACHLGVLKRPPHPTRHINAPLNKYPHTLHRFSRHSRSLNSNDRRLRLPLAVAPDARRHVARVVQPHHCDERERYAARSLYTCSHDGPLRALREWAQRVDGALHARPTEGRHRRSGDSLRRAALSAHRHQHDSPALLPFDAHPPTGERLLLRHRRRQLALRRKRNRPTLLRPQRQRRLALPTCRHVADARRRRSDEPQSISVPMDGCQSAVGDVAGCGRNLTISTPHHNNTTPSHHPNTSTPHHNTTSTPQHNNTPTYLNISTPHHNNTTPPQHNTPPFPPKTSAATIRFASIRS